MPDTFQSSPSSNHPRRQTPHPRAFLVGVERANQKVLWSIEDSLEELKELAETAGVVVAGSLSQKLREPNPRYYVGKGKVEELKDWQAELGFEMAIFDDELSPGQQRNLERALGIRVVDRTALILDIFAQRARTREGRLQVELAQYEYMLPRLTRQWTHLSRQYGAIGARGGPGETQLEVDKRRVRERIGDVKAEIEEVRRHRALYRERRAREGIPVVALVGYTNAGKSTLLNALTGAGVVAEDRLFATLDPTTRRVRLPSGREVLVTDTVGFIQKLPHMLIAAFRATLEELESADALLHVMDIAQHSGYEQGETVRAVLRDLGLADKPVITVLNKIDLLRERGPREDEIVHEREDASRSARDFRGCGNPILGENVDARLRGHDDGKNGDILFYSEPLGDDLTTDREPGRSIDELVALYENAVAVSAAKERNLPALLEKIDVVLAGELVDITVLVPYSAGRLVALFREKGTVLEEAYTQEGTRIKGRISLRFAEGFRKYARS